LTVRHLLTHTGGFFGDRFDDFGGGEDALARSIETFATLRQYTPPGAFWAYNNLGFQVAGRVVEQVAGRPFETMARERVFAPLGMEHTTYFADEAITYPVAVGHLGGTDGRSAVTHAWAKSRCRNAQGGVLSTVGDLLRFARAHLGGGAYRDARIVSAAGAAEMQRPQVEAIQAPHWGLGWWVDAVDGETIVGHGGVTNGFQAQLTLVPARGAAFAFLSNGNQGGAAIRSIETWLFERCLGLKRTEPPAVALGEDVLRRLAGRYEGALARCTVRPKGGGLALEVERISPYIHQVAPPVSMDAEPIDGKRFRFTDGVDKGSLFDFVDAHGESSDSPRYLRLNNRLLDRVR
jgi:CubicO group peptidase (beta-lactamase class C family)